MVKIEKIFNQEAFIPMLRFTVDIAEELVQEHFMYNRLNSASQMKMLLMEEVGRAYEDYVRRLADIDDFEYLDKEFSAIKVIDERFPDSTNL